MKTYKIEWSKTYVARGTEEIEATSEKEAYDMIFEMLGDLTGSMDYLADKDHIDIQEV